MKPLTFLTLIFAAALPAADVPYPEGYRNWRHVKSMVILPGHSLYGSFGGIHHIYANPKAVSGYRTGVWPDGAVIVFDLLEAESKDGAITEGARKVTGVMHRGALLYKGTGGWGFEGFQGGRKTERAGGPAAATACFACHASQKARSFVFSALRE